MPYSPITRRALEAEAQGVLPETVADIDAAEQAKALNAVRAQIPDFDRDEANAAAFLQANPALAQRYMQLYPNDPQAAMEWGVLTYRASNPQRAPSAEDEQRPITGGHDPFARRDPFARYRESEDRRAAAQALFKNSGDLVGAAHLLAGRSIGEHFEHREEPGRGGR